MPRRILYSGFRWKQHHHRSGYQQVVPKGADTVDGGTLPFGDAPFRSLGNRINLFLTDLVTAFKGLRYDCVFVFYPEHSVYISPAVLRLAGVKVVYAVHIDEQYWLPHAAWSALGRESATAMIDIGTRARKLLDATVVETELMSTRSPMLVDDARHNERVHAELRELNKAESYLVVPIVIGSRVGGFIHVDNLDGNRPVDDVDLDALALYGACFGFAVERIGFSEQLASVRRQLDGEEKIWPGVVEGGPKAAGPRTGSFHGRRGGPTTGLGSLTERELEVLDQVAAGRTNRAIATQLFVSESTVKAHVKHILRKLGAANRAEAVSRHLYASAHLA